MSFTLLAQSGLTIPLVKTMKKEIVPITAPIAIGTIELMTKQLKTRISNADLAKELGLSESSFYDNFQQATG